MRKLSFKASVVMSCLLASSVMSAAPKAKNVILLIGDGMGITQIFGTMTEAEKPMTFMQFPYTGICITSSANAYVTDSAASGTAIACGEKTDNGMIGQLPDGTDVASIRQELAEEGLATGVVATSTITHATPAAFVGHQPKRSMEEELAADFVTYQPDVFIGGGRKYFEQRKDGRNLTNELKALGYDVQSDIEGVEASKSDKLCGLLENEALPAIITDGENRKSLRGDILPRAAEKAIEVLSRDKDGFFLMIEGSQIDWAGHGNDSERVVAETIDFDQAIAKALAFAEKDGETLVLVTADHETGGLTLVGGSREEHSIDVHFSTKNHTATPVMIFAYGPGAEKFSGIMENTEIKERIEAAMK